MLANNLFERRHHVLAIFFRHPGKEWQGEDPFRGVAGIGQLGVGDRHVLPVPGMVVDGLVVQAAADVVLLQALISHSGICFYLLLRPTLIERFMRA